jgi:hypothetical protein
MLWYGSVSRMGKSRHYIMTKAGTIRVFSLLLAKSNRIARQTSTSTLQAPHPRPAYNLNRSVTHAAIHLSVAFRR